MLPELPARNSPAPKKGGKPKENMKRLSTNSLQHGGSPPPALFRTDSIKKTKSKPRRQRHHSEIRINESIDGKGSEVEGAL